MSNLSDFLTTDYVAHFGVIWNAATMSLRTEYPASICFEIAVSIKNGNEF